MNEPLDIRKLNERNLDEIAELTGRSRRYLEQELATANAHHRVVHIIVNNPMVYPRRPRPMQEDCDYDAIWSEKVGWTYICRIHHKPSWHNVAEQPGVPCIAIDPKPDDV